MGDHRRGCRPRGRNLQGRGDLSHRQPRYHGRVRARAQRLWLGRKATGERGAAMSTLPMKQVCNTVIHGDCIEAKRRMESASVDFILTDPPYLCRYRSRDGQTIANDDHDGWLLPAFTEMHRVLTPGSLCLSFYGWYSADKFIRV